MPPDLKPRLVFRSAGRNSVSWLLCLALLGGSTGLSLPKLPRRDRTEPFPCMDHACGCEDLAACRDYCCCFSPAEKLAWARRQGLPLDPWRLPAGDAEAGSSSASHACCSRRPDTGLSAPCGSLADSGTPACDPGMPVLVFDQLRRCGGVERFRALLQEVVPAERGPGIPCDRSSGARLELPAYRALWSVSTFLFRPPRG